MSLFLTKTKDPPKAERAPRLPHPPAPFPTVLRVHGADSWSPSRGGTHSSAAGMTQGWACPWCVFQAWNQAGFPCALHRYLSNESQWLSVSPALAWLQGLGFTEGRCLSCFPGGACPALSVLFSLFPPLFHLTKGGLLASVPQNSIHRLGC